MSVQYHAVQLGEEFVLELRLADLFRRDLFGKAESLTCGGSGGIGCLTVVDRPTQFDPGRVSETMLSEVGGIADITVFKTRLRVQQVEELSRRA